MKKLLSTLIMLTVGVISNAQVGIGTQNPVRDLHIAQPNASIAIDGLNNSNQNSTSESKGLYATNQGVLVTTEDINIVYEYKSDGTNVNPYFQRDTMYVKSSERFTTKKLGTDLNFVNKADGILMLTFQPNISLNYHNEELYQNSSARTFGIKLLIKDAANHIVHQLSREVLFYSSVEEYIEDEECINNVTDDNFDACYRTTYMGGDLNVNLSTQTYIPAGDYKIEIYGTGYRSNDPNATSTGTDVDVSLSVYTVTYSHDIDTEMNVYIIHP